MKVRILSTPKQRPQLPNVKPFSSPYNVPTPQAKYGGARENMGNVQNGSSTPVKNQYVDMGWEWMKGAQGTGYVPGPYSSVGKNLPEVPENEADINAEKQEKIMGDFNGDGMPVLMNVDGKPHTEGGKNIGNLPDNSFVFSDTKNLTIKDPEILQQFGQSKSGTPAQIAKKYDLQKYKAVVDNPESDDLEKQTAQYNYINAVNKLNTLAQSQEAMKQRKGIPSSVPDQPMRYGGIPKDQNGIYIPGMPNDEVTITAPKPGDQRLPIIGGNGVYSNDMPYDPNKTPYDNVYPDQPLMSTVDLPGLPPVNMGSDGNNRIARKAPQWNYNHDILNPDTERDLMLGLRAASYPKYQPVRQIARNATPQTVFLDPTRALAAEQEAGNAAGYQASISDRGPVSRAIAQDAQGRVGSQGADTVAKYAEANTGIANRANELAAQNFNKTWEQQQQYTQKYNEDQINELRDRYGFTTQMANEFLKGQYEDRQRRATAHNYNFINPYYTMDSQGFLNPKTAEQRKAVLGITGTQGGQNTGSGMSPEEVERHITNYHLTGEEANKFRRSAAMMALRGPSTTMKTNAMGVYTGSSQRGYNGQVSNPYSSQQFIPAEEPETEKYGGKPGKRKMRIVSTP